LRQGRQRRGQDSAIHEAARARRQWLRMTAEKSYRLPFGRLLLAGSISIHPMREAVAELRSFHYAREITVKDGIGQVARVKDRNSGRTRELDYLGGLLRDSPNVSRGSARLGPRCVIFFYVEREILARLALGATAAAVDPLGGAAGTSSRAYQRQEQGWIAGVRGLHACDSVRAERPPRRAMNQNSDQNSISVWIDVRIGVRIDVRIGVRTNVRFRGRGFAATACLRASSTASGAQR